MKEYSMMYIVLELLWLSTLAAVSIAIVASGLVMIL